MPDKNIIFNSYACANEGMTRYFAACAHLGTTLDFHKAADSCVITDFAAIQIYITIEADAVAKFDVCGNAQARYIRCSSHILMTFDEPYGERNWHSR